MKSTKITAVVFAKNEEQRLPLIFENLSNFSEIVVFDGGSTDHTKELCDLHGVQFISRPPENRHTVAADAKFVWAHVKTPYVLAVNCSHYYPRLLLDECKRIAEEGRYKAVYHDVVIYTYGQVVHRPFFRRRSSACNFYHVGVVNFENSKVHNETPVEARPEDRRVLPAKDEYAIHLFRDYDVAKAEANHSFYGDQDAKFRFESGVRANLWSMIWRPVKYFLHQYMRCGSIKYGTAGFVYAALFAQLEMNIQFKIWELQNQHQLRQLIRKNLSLREAMYKSESMQ